MNNTFLRYFVILICIICQKFKHYYCKCIFGFYEIYVLTYYGTLNIGSRIKYCTKNDKVYISLISLSFQYGRHLSSTTPRPTAVDTLAQMGQPKFIDTSAHVKDT